MYYHNGLRQKCRNSRSPPRGIQKWFEVKGGGFSEGSSLGSQIMWHPKAEDTHRVFFPLHKDWSNNLQSDPGQPMSPQLWLDNRRQRQFSYCTKAFCLRRAHLDCFSNPAPFFGNFHGSSSLSIQPFTHCLGSGPLWNLFQLRMWPRSITPWYQGTTAFSLFPLPSGCSVLSSHN